jgi:NRPS condensation-like uncharacterized protein
MDSQTYRLLINFDHLAIDGFSLSKWFEDLHRVYEQLLQGQAVSDSPQTSINFKIMLKLLPPPRMPSNAHKTWTTG